MRTAVAAQQPSSDAGADAKRYSLRTFTYVDRTLDSIRAELRAAKRGRFRAARRHGRSAVRNARRWTANARRANRAFRRAGVR